jgi:hypothetical protein
LRVNGGDGADGSGRRRDAGGETEITAGGGASPETMRKRVSQHSFGSDLDGEVEDDMGNRSRVFGGGEIGRGGGATVSGGLGDPASSCGRGRARERGESAGELPYPVVKLWRRLAVAEGRWNDGAVAARGAGGNGGGGGRGC